VGHWRPAGSPPRRLGGPAECRAGPTAQQRIHWWLTSAALWAAAPSWAGPAARRRSPRHNLCLVVTIEAAAHHVTPKGGNAVGGTPAQAEPRPTGVASTVRAAWGAVARDCHARCLPRALSAMIAMTTWRRQLPPPPRRGRHRQEHRPALPPPPHPPPPPSLHGAASTERDSIPARVTEQAGNERDSAQLMFGSAALDRRIVQETGATCRAHDLHCLRLRFR